MPPSDQESCRKRRQATSAVLATAPLVASTRPKSPAADPPPAASAPAATTVGAGTGFLTPFSSPFSCCAPSRPC
jgi:hypothetical protein